ncbi:MAG: choice-of-anchor tandem repeat GloVer-containing protein, partial [Acidimicrobiales bacterium]
TELGGPGLGVVFKLTPGGTETVLHSFCMQPNCSDGAYPLAGLIADSSGNLYGTTEQGGGASGQGVVFKLTPGGNETVLYSICTFPGCSGGSRLNAGLIADSSGNLYGTATDGGMSGGCSGTGCGVVFKLSPGGTETVLHSFTGSPIDGANPYAGLIADSSGNLYGTTYGGGASQNGVVFKLTPGGTETVLYSFCSLTGCSDGAAPQAGLIADSSGNLYGTTAAGGASAACTVGCGVVFKLTPGGTETVLYSFTGGGDGALPEAGLIADSSGNLYGTTEIGGALNSGTVFKLTGTGFATPPAYVTNTSSNTVSVLATATNTVVATVPVGGAPEGVAVTQDGQHAYVANAGSNTVSVIDTVANTVAATVTVGGKPKGVAVAPDGKHAYVTDSGSGTVSVIKTSTNAVTATVGVGANPFGVAITPDGTHAYVTNSGSSTVSVIATASKTVVATVTVGLTPKGVAVAPDGLHVYVANAGSNNVSVIRTATNAVVATVTVGLRPNGIAVTQDGTQAYVANSSDGTVSVIDTATKTVVGAPIPVGNVPIGIAFTLDGKHAHVTNSGDGSVSVIRTAKKKVVATVAVGTSPFGAGIRP